MTEYEIGDDEYDETEEVNTSYDQNQPIGDEPQALNTEWSNSEPIDAKTGQDFLDIQIGGQAQKIDEGWRDTLDDIINGDWIYTDEEKKELYGKEFKTVWQELGYESLNQDGTGVRMATRGINPKKTPSKVLRFVYVSKSDCPICKPHDGHSWAIDSPNRPIIPRLETKHGDRPFTHPHCKCKWVNVFSDVESNSSEVNQADFDRTRKWYGAGFDKLTVIEQKMVMIDMLKQSLGMEKNAEEDIIDPVPIASMAHIAFNALKPTIKHKLGIESKQNEYTKDDSYRSECQICGAPLDEHPITEGNDPHEWLAEQPADWEGDMSPANEDIYDNAWDGLSDEQKRMYNTLDDVESEGSINKTEYLQIANAMGVKRGNEGGKGSGRPGHQKWMLAGEAGEECPNCMMITERKDGKCTICGE